MKKILLALTLSCLIFSGCSRVNVSYQLLEDGDYQAYSSFAWLGDMDDSNALQVEDPRTRSYITERIETELEGKGYVMSDKDQADFLIAWFGRVDEVVKKQSIAHFYDTYGYDTLSHMFQDQVDAAAIVTSFSQGELTLHIVDPDTRSIIWQGAASEALADQMDEGDVTRYLDRLIHAILNSLPNR